MNVKGITKVLHSLSLLSEEDVEMVFKLRALTEDERSMLMFVLEPQKPAAKKSSMTTRVYERCVQCGKTKGHSFHKDSSNDGYHLFQLPQPIKTAGKKSARTQSLGEQLKQRPRGVVTGDDEEGPFCNICHHNEGYQDHFKPSPNYHEFEPGKSAASPAPPPSDQASSGIGAADVSSAAQGAGGGD